MTNQLDSETIYEIFRACRLCGAGGGYKMPIIQNVVAFDCPEVELKKKIKECLQLEVHPNDKMPPLVCELCVDKLNDFYEFLEMSRQTNKRTRIRLGLPMTTSPAMLEAGDCIVGVTEPVLSKTKEEQTPTRRTKVAAKKSKLPDKDTKKEDKKEDKKEEKKEKKIVKGLKKELESLIQDVPMAKRASRSVSIDVRRPTRASDCNATSTDVRRTRQDRKSIDAKSIDAPKTRSSSDTPKPKPITKKENIKKETKNEKEDEATMVQDSDDEVLASPRPKRARVKEQSKPEVPQKKVKQTVPPPAPPAPPPPPPLQCDICHGEFKTKSALVNHLRSHNITFTPHRLACNACGLWFLSLEEAATHHKQHRARTKPYRCRHCHRRYAHYSDFNKHQSNLECKGWTEVPDVKCEECWKLFPTNNLLLQHKCLGADSRPGGKCSNCSRTYQTQKNLKKHEATCTPKKKEKVATVAPPQPMETGLPPMQVRIVRVDTLLKKKRGRYDVSNLGRYFGLDRYAYYPYLPSVKVKSERLAFDGMVSINKEIRDELYREEDYVHWDSDNSTDSECQETSPIDSTKIKKVPTLTALTMKTIFAKRCLGRIPKKLRKVRDKFDSLLNTDFDDNTSINISNMTDNLDNESKANYDSDSIIADSVKSSAPFRGFETEKSEFEKDDDETQTDANSATDFEKDDNDLNQTDGNSVTDFEKGDNDLNQTDGNSAMDFEKDDNNLSQPDVNSATDFEKDDNDLSQPDFISATDFEKDDNDLSQPDVNSATDFEKDDNDLNQADLNGATDFEKDDNDLNETDVNSGTDFEKDDNDLNQTDVNGATDFEKDDNDLNQTDGNSVIDFEKDDNDLNQTDINSATDLLNGDSVYKDNFGDENETDASMDDTEVTDDVGKHFENNDDSLNNDEILSSDSKITENIIGDDKFIGNGTVDDIVEGDSEIVISNNLINDIEGDKENFTNDDQNSFDNHGMSIESDDVSQNGLSENSQDILEGFQEKINGDPDKSFVTFSEDDKNLLEELDAQIGDDFVENSVIGKGNIIDDVLASDDRIPLDAIPEEFCLDP